MSKHYCDWLGCESNPVTGDCDREARMFVDGEEVEFPFWLCAEHYDEYLEATSKKENVQRYAHRGLCGPQCHCGGLSL